MNLPIIQSLKNYQSAYLKGDLSAGLTVGVMLIPQGMAYAMIAGLPPIYGLYASTVPLIIYAMFGTSRQLAVGPVAMVSLLTAAGIGTLAEAGSETYISLAIVLAFLVGSIQFVLGLFRMGFLVNFLSHPVISGFTSAAALIIGLSQLKNLLGIDLQGSHHIHKIIWQSISQFDQIHWTTFILGLTGIILILGVKKVHKALPGPLLAVIFGVLAVWGMNLTDSGIKIVGNVPEGLPSLALPSLSFGAMNDLLPLALTIALVSFMESIAVAKAIQSKHKTYTVDPNQELIALGLSNLGGSLAQSYPVTGGFSRTAVNDQSGAKTALASVFSALLIILTLLFLTPLFYYLPNAILASVIMVAVFGLIDIKEVKYLWAVNRADFWMLLVTFIATLSLGIEKGIGVGVLLSLGMLIFRTSRPHMAILGNIPGTAFYRNKDRFTEVICREELLIVRFDAQMYFANMNYFKDQLFEFENQKGKNLKVVILSAESINSIDSSAIHDLHELIDNHRTRGISLLFAGVKGPVRDAMEKGKVTSKLGHEHFFMNIHSAVSWYDQTIAERTKLEGLEKYILQTN